MDIVNKTIKKQERSLTANWSTEMEDELTSVMSNQMRHEIDRVIIQEIKVETLKKLLNNEGVTENDLEVFAKHKDFLMRMMRKVYPEEFI